jgi:hypothetical protein
MYQIFFVGLPDDRGTLVVIVLGGTHFFKVSLERYASTIPSHLLGALELAQVDPSKLQPQYLRNLERNIFIMKAECPSSASFWMRDTLKLFRLGGAYPVVHHQFSVA